MGLIDEWWAGVAQGKRREEERQIIERHMKERQNRQAALNPPPLSQAFGQAAVKVRPVANKVVPVAKGIGTAAVNWVFTGSADGVRRTPPPPQRQRAPRPRQAPSRSRQRVVYVREPEPPRGTFTPEPEEFNAMAGWGDKRKKGGNWGGGW